MDAHLHRSLQKSLQLRRIKLSQQLRDGRCDIRDALYIADEAIEITLHLLNRPGELIQTTVPRGSLVPEFMDAALNILNRTLHLLDSVCYLAEAVEPEALEGSEDSEQNA